MFSESPELYDVIYSSFKDYASESQAVATLLTQVAPDARDILDVGCGTGEHARHLQCTHEYRVDGLDIEPGFLQRARAKLPDSTFWQGDMSDFSLGRSYDAVLCLFRHGQESRAGLGLLLRRRETTRPGIAAAAG